MSECQHRSISTFYHTESGDPSGLWACAECSRRFVPIDRELALEKENAKLRERLAQKDEQAEPVVERPTRSPIDDGLPRPILGA